MKYSRNRRCLYVAAIILAGQHCSIAAFKLEWRATPKPSLIFATGVAPKQTSESSWEDHFQQLKQYIEENGDCSVPVSFESKDGVKLGTWVKRQRQAHRKGSMSEEQSGRLNEVGLVWRPLESSWEDGLQRLEQYTKEHGDSLVPYSYEEKDGVKLGIWVDTQRTIYRKGSMSEERHRRLNELGFAWYLHGYSWEHKFQRLEQYIEENGDCLVPEYFKTKDGVKLGVWVKRQRQAHRKGSISEEQSGRLNELGFRWYLHTSSWEDKFQRLEQYIEENGDCLVPENFKTKDGTKLGSWVNRHRQAHRKGSLSDESFRRLNELGFEWYPLPSLWEGNFQRLDQYIKEHGHCSVTNSFETKDGVKLGNWVSSQRTHYRKGSLSEDRSRRLNELGFLWSMEESNWEDKFWRLEKYIKEHGGCSVPRSFVTKDGIKLGDWVSTQRLNYRKGRLSEERSRRFKEAGGFV